MIDLAAVRSLIAVRDHGSVVAAADALDFTPSAVSQQIKRLEHGNRLPMLERVGRGVVLTDRGRLLAERGSLLLDQLEELEHLVLAGDDVVAGPFHLATFSTANRGLVAPLLARLATTTPALDATVHEGDPRDIVSLVARGQADAGLVHDWTSMRLDLPDGVESTTLLVDTADVVLHRDHRLAEADMLSPRDLLEDPWVCTPAGTICHDWLLHMFAVHDVRPRLPYVDNDYATHLAMVAAGVAVALVPRLGRTPLPPDVVVVPVVDPTPQRKVQLIWRRSATSNPARRHLQAELETIAREI
ncbi:LysR family transcriptional regulator [Aeromicrobium halocynthiae]|uniref:LysR family transcriptional regulator n=1 Tax=Aeromicrobium halocynthiae TaxID=560557 RepID=A0ABP5HPR2_9ACTN